MPRERILVNFFYCHPVGHAVEALRYCLGYHAADPEREVGVVLNAATAVELVSFCPFVSHAFAVDHPLFDRCGDSSRRLSAVPPNWDWVLDDFRRHQPIQQSLFPGLADYYAASDRRLTARHGRSTVGSSPPSYLRHQQLRFELPPGSRERARRRMCGDGTWGGARRITIMPAGSGPPAMYPSTASWLMILDALTDAFPEAGITLVGRLARDDRTATAIGPADLAALHGHRSHPIDGFDLPLDEQLAIIEAGDLFLSPHTGFGFTALAVGTPWLTLSGGRWFEYFFNQVPFRSIFPDTERYPCFTQFDPAPTRPDGEDGPRTPSMSRARIAEDLPRIIAAAEELIDGSLGYEDALRVYFADLLDAHLGDASAIWSIDGVHLDYLPAPHGHGS